MSVTVKICGITTHAAAEAAAAAGADAVGLMFFEGSPRHVTIEKAAEISAVLPPQIVRVGVFVNAEEALIQEAMGACTLNILQFHGDESPEDCARFNVMTIKALRVKGPETLDEMGDYGVDGFLLDAFSETARGGTGESFDWELAARARELGRPIFLAGGLTPENVAEAVRTVQPFAVDVSSGVEITPGEKCPDKMRAFVSGAKEALG